MPTPVRFGILGLSMGLGRARIAGEYPDAEVGCVCALSEERAREAGEEFGCAWTTSYEEMLRRDDLDVIGVWSASGDHCHHAVMALEAGFHALTTKPMDIRVAACKEAIAAAERAGKVLAVDFGLRYEPRVRKLRQALADGVIGDVFLADLQMKWMREQSYYDGGEPAGWRSRRATEGGSIANQGVHMVDELQWLLGRVRAVEFARIATVAHAIETEDLCNVALTFETGAWGWLETTTSAFPSRGTGIEINGREGSVVINGDDDIQVMRVGGEEVSVDETVVSDEWPRHCIEDMVWAVRDQRGPVCPGADGMHSVEIIEGAYEAARTGARVVLGAG